MESIRSEQRGAWRKVVLNRPDRLNAFNDKMHEALARVLEDAAGGPRCRAVLLTDEGRGFCAGQDLNDRLAGGAGDCLAGGAGEVDLGSTVERFYNPLVRRLRSLPKPMVCAVNGVAAGAGANIALACDIVLAARSARFVQAFAKIGLIPDSGGTFFLPRLVGEARARALAVLAEPLPAEVAAAWGLIWKAVDDDALLAEAEALTEHLAAQPTQGVALTKRAPAASAANTLDARLDLERDLQRQAGQTPDDAEGVQAFLDKKRPDFTGRPRPGGSP